MKQILLLCLLSLCFGVQAQLQSGLKGAYDEKNFPNGISSEWNEYNTQQRVKNDFSLNENGRDIPFELDIQKSGKAKNVLFILEDMASHNGQYNAFKQILTSFLSNIRNNDKFNVLVFNRRPFDGKGTEKYRLLSENFVSGGELLAKINAYPHSTAHYSQQDVAADLYASIEDALKIISTNESNDKMIVLMTAGLNVTVSGATKERASLEEEARKANIPIYAVYFPYQGNYNIPPNIQGIAENTNGKVIIATNTTEATNQLRKYYSNLNMRSYRFTFTTSQKRDGKSHEVVLKLPNGKSEIVSFTAPKMTFELWIKEKLWLFIGLVVAFMSIMVLAIVLVVRSKKKKEAAIQANLDNIRQEADAKTIAAKQEAEKIRQEQLAYQQKQEHAKRESEAQAEEERLIRLMQNKNLFPRLQCRVGNNNFTYNISKPSTTIGRENDNDLALDNEKVSRHHAEIVFTGGGFEIIDKKSTNKVIINGQFFERATLKSGDVIGLGESVITFYV